MPVCCAIREMHPRMCCIIGYLAFLSSYISDIGELQQAQKYLEDAAQHNLVCTFVANVLKCYKSQPRNPRWRTKLKNCQDF